MGVEGDGIKGNNLKIALFQTREWFVYPDCIQIISTVGPGVVI